MANLKWYKVAEIVEKTGLSPYRVRKLIDKDIIHGTRLSGQRMVLEEELKEFIEQFLGGTADLSRYNKKRWQQTDEEKETAERMKGWDDPGIVGDVPRAKEEDDHPEPPDDAYGTEQDQARLDDQFNMAQREKERQKKKRQQI